MFAKETEETYEVETAMKMKALSESGHRKDLTGVWCELLLLLFITLIFIQFNFYFNTLEKNELQSQDFIKHWIISI